MWVSQLLSLTSKWTNEGGEERRRGFQALITLNESMQLFAAAITIQCLDLLPFPLPAVGAFDQQFPLLFLATCGAPYTSQTPQAQPYFTASLAPPAPGNHNPHRPEWRKWLWFPSTFRTSNGEGDEGRMLVLTELNKQTRATVCVCVRAYVFLCHLNCVCVLDTIQRVWRNRWVHFYAPLFYISVDIMWKVNTP